MLIKNSDQELEEFVEIAQGEMTDNSSRQKPSFTREYDDYDREDRELVGEYCQYFERTGGFSPATPTIKNLPASVYRIVIKNGEVIFEPHNIFTDDLLLLPDSRSKEVIEEIEKFWGLQEKFDKLGFLFKRGFLLWGSPGSGKTSTLAFVVKQMIKRKGIVFLGDIPPELLGMGLKKFREIEPDRHAIVILEDIDTLISSYGEAEMLSILDGESSISNVVYLSTTNYPEQLDNRIINRPSRFDRIVKIGMPNAEARHFYLKNRKLGLNEKELKQWVEQTEGFSIAHLKELIIGVMCFGNSFEGEIKRLRGMAKTPRNEELNKKAGF